MEARRRGDGTPALPGGAGFTLAARRSMPKPGRGFQVLSEGFSPQSPHAGEDARAPRMHVVLSSWFLVLGSGRPRSQGARGSRFSVLGSRFGTSAHPGGTWFSVLGSWFSVLGSWFLVLGSWFLVLDSGRPHTQGRSGLRVCGRDARAPGTRRIARMRAGRPRTQGARGSPLLQGWYGIGARRVPGCPIAVRPVHATFRDGKQKPRTRSPQLPGAVWRARPAQ